ncbi:MAG TPA: ABC transporter substrate-binding protein [Candidatus Krumholzibacteria bacterium]|nr:ABC transporter substrate-binding protein [Candidatus Krumholzibacteria bacterium]HPD70768.1 ABC transporter substrate-binding protein [Candidatus Krumholzibacteria bacterium]HRY39532.1 ABC transporter substrate-binding protein [Candidatus Krumholzibacteria bacterium]
MIVRRHCGRFAGLLLWLLAGACNRDVPPVESGPGEPGESAPWADAPDCAPIPGDPDRGGDLVVVLGEPVDPSRAPVPSNPGERTVFANLYETLTLVGCDGELTPGLADHWRRLDDGRRWQLRLRDGAVFWDGTPVTAGDVVRAWTENETLARDLGRPCPGLWLAAGGGLLTVDRRTIEIRLPEAQDDLPHLLAHPDLAVAAHREGWRWPVGSGPCRLAADSAAPAPDLVCRPNLHHPQPPAWASLRFRCLPGRDARELLGPGTDLAVIRDRRAAEYYDQLPGVRSAPLPWDRLYALLLPPGREISDAGLALAAQGAATVAENRPWRSLDFHGCRATPCPQLQGPTLGGPARPEGPEPPLLAAPGAGRLAYRDDDADARALAERAAAFLGAGFALGPCDGPALAGALQAADAAAYVVRLDACYPTACLALASLLARADWLQREAAGTTDACAAAARLVASRRVVPLVVTRNRLVWQAPLAGLALTHDGAILVGHLGRARPAETP